MKDIVFSSTTQLATAIRAGDVSATEVLEAHLTQIGRHNPALNAIVTLDAEGAYERAREADRALARGEIWGPLHGVPFTLKDAHADYQTNNPIFGRTNNLWNIERTPGGSSGGAVAALAAGMSPFDIGTDLSVSIRIPAHFCGVYGLKPTERRVPLTGLIPGLPSPRPIRIMSCIGPMARSVEDLALLYSILAGPDGHETEVQPVPVDTMPDLELKRLRIAFAPTFPGLPVAAEIRGAVEELAKQLSPLCAAVEEAAPPEVDFTQDLVNAGALIGMMLGAFQPEEQEQPTTLAQYLEALDRRDQSILAWEQFFEKWDVLLCPASMTTAFPHCEPGSPLYVDGQDVIYWTVSGHGTLFNYSGHPAVVLPENLDRDGLPLGIQLVGKRWDEARLLAMAKALSEVSGAFQRPPGY